LLVQPAPRAHKASKDPSVPRAPSASAGRLALPDRPDRSDRRVRRVKPVAKAQSDPAAKVDRQDRRAPLAQPARPDRRARRVTPARHRQFASSPVRIAFAAETTKSWLVLFARAVRPTERSARRPARHQPVYVYVDDLGHRVATSSTFSNSTMRWGTRVDTRFADNELACAPKRPSEHRPRTSGAPISSHTPTPGFSYSLTLLRLRCWGARPSHRHCGFLRFRRDQQPHCQLFCRGEAATWTRWLGLRIYRKKSTIGDLGRAARKSPRT